MPAQAPYKAGSMQHKMLQFLPNTARAPQFDHFKHTLPVPAVCCCIPPQGLDNCVRSPVFAG